MMVGHHARVLFGKTPRKGFFPGRGRPKGGGQAASAVATECAIAEAASRPVQLEMDVSAGGLSDVAEFNRSIRKQLTALRNAVVGPRICCETPFPASLTRRWGFTLTTGFRRN
jgi:hypothetical protein